MKYIDLNKQYLLMKDAIQANMTQVLEHGQFILGPEVTQMEQALAERLGIEHGVACASGTTALQLALMAIDLQPGDEVITTPFSFFGTAAVVYLLGAKPVYVDIDPHTYNINPALIEAAITSRTKAIIPVNVFGQCADYDAINAIAAKHRLVVIEDAAQSFGASYKGRPSCALSTISCTSFFPSKPLGCYGDGGACFTRDATLAKRMRLLANHGQEGRYHHVMVGINGRMDSLQAAIILAKLPWLDRELAQRQQVASWYDQAFGQQVKRQAIEAYNISAYAQYTIEVEGRDALRAALTKKNIPTSVHYPCGLHEQPIAQQLSSEFENLKQSEMITKRVLSLPFHPYMERHEVLQVVEAVLQAQ